jgi:hypothetical protein
MGANRSKYTFNIESPQHKIEEFICQVEYLQKDMSPNEFQKFIKLAWVMKEKQKTSPEWQQLATKYWKLLNIIVPEYQL